MYKKFFSGFIALCFAGSLLHAQDAADASYDLDEVVVTASRMGLSRKNIPQKVEIIDSKKIATIPAGNAADLLKRTVNLDIIEYPGLSAQIGMRGFSPTAHSRSYTLLLIDGVPSGTTNLASIPIAIIDRIEVVKGPYSVLYGSDAMGGVINIITKSTSSEGVATLGAKGGSFGQFEFREYANVPMSDRFSFLFSLSRKVQTGDYRIGRNNTLSTSNVEELILDKESYGKKMTNSKYNTNQVSTKLNYLISRDWSASLASFITINRDVETPGNYWHTYGDSKKDLYRINLMGQIKRSTDRHTLVVSPYFSSDKEHFFNALGEDAFVNLIGKTREYGVKINNTNHFGDFSLLTGVDYDIYDYRSKRFKEANIPDAPYQPDNKNQKLSALAQLAYNSGRLSANAGIRYNYITYSIDENKELQTKEFKHNYSNVNPSVGIKLDIVGGLKLHSSFGTAFSVPDAFKVAGDYKVETYFPDFDFWWKQVYVGNKDLDPETSNTFDVGLEYNHPFFSVDATYFTTRHKNMIIKDTKMTNDTVRYINSDKALMDGIELMGSVDFAAMAGYKSKLELYSGFTMLFNSHSTVENSNGEGSITRDLLSVRKVNGNFGIFFDTNDKFSTRLHARYIGKRLETDSFSDLRPEIKAEDYHTKGGYTADDKVLQHPAHLVFDYSAYYNVTPKARLGISVSNLLDENYTEKDGYNMPGRSIMGSLNYTF